MCRCFGELKEQCDGLSWKLDDGILSITDGKHVAEFSGEEILREDGKYAFLCYIIGCTVVTKIKDETTTPLGWKK
jgi:hypothetical protein